MFAASKIVWLLIEPSMALTLLAILGALLCWTRWLRLGRAIAFSSAFLLLAAGFMPLGNLLLRPLEERFPAFGDDGGPVAGVIVLGGALTSEVSEARGQFSVNEAAERLTAMAALARRYPQAKIVFSGGSGDLAGIIPSEADSLRKVIEELMPAGRVTYERASRNTFENAVMSRMIVQPKPGERWLLVTSAWHMPRSVGLFRRAGWTITPYPVDYRTTGRGDDWRPTGSVSAGLRRTDLAVKEWIGLTFAWITGQSAELWPG